jgi:hypothetical protein
MTGQGPTLLIFLGGMGGTGVEDRVASARRAATLDTIGIAAAGGISRAIVVTDHPNLKADLAGVEVVADEGTHHFGSKLVEVIRDRGLGPVVYLGGGSVPLLRSEDFAMISETIESGKAVTNNRFSSDLVAWRVEDRSLDVLTGLDRDNPLARALQDSGVEVTEMPRTAETVFDIDTPSDLAILAVTGLGGDRLKVALQGLEIDLEPYQRLLPLFVDSAAELVVSGRVGTHSWQYLERETACRVRMFAEERGMGADGRKESGQVRSMVGYMLDAVGVERFFDILAELGDAAVIDTRVILAHRGVSVSRADRFLSDAGRWNEIEEPFLREFTKMARECSIPVLLGGHSLVSGGLMALNEFAWQQNEAGLLSRG